MDASVRKTLIKSIFRTAKAGLGVAAHSAQQGGGRRRKRMKKGAQECTPCQAYGAVQDAFDRVRNGSL